MSALGLQSHEIETLLKAQRTLRNWGEQECGNSNNYASWSIERDEETGKPYMVTYPHTGKTYRRAIADRERGALARVSKIIAAHHGLGFYHQGDPRGCALHVGKLADIPEGKSVDAFYNRWIACC